MTRRTLWWTSRAGGEITTTRTVSIPLCSALWVYLNQFRKWEGQVRSPDWGPMHPGGLHGGVASSPQTFSFLMVPFPSREILTPRLHCVSVHMLHACLCFIHKNSKSCGPKNQSLPLRGVPVPTWECILYQEVTAWSGQKGTLGKTGRRVLPFPCWLRSLTCLHVTQSTECF